MSSVESSKPELPSRLSSLILLTKGVYSRVKHSHTLVESSCSKFEPFFYSAAAKLTSARSSAGTIISASVSNCISVKVSLSEKKELYRASLLAWLSARPKNLSDFMEALKSQLHSKWSDSYEKLAAEFYYKSLNYNPQKALKLLADILSQGSESFKSALESSKKSGFRHFLVQLRENLGDKWNESYAEAGKVYKSIWKAKDKLLLEHNFTQDWRSKARKSAEMATVIIFAGADELYIWSLNNLTQSYAVMFNDILAVVPFKGTFLSALQKIQAFDKQDLLELTWPEDVKTSFEPIAKKVGLETWLTKNWHLLDCDEDGTVTVDDVCAAVVLVVKGSFKAAMQVVPFKNYMLKNGEEV